MVEISMSGSGEAPGGVTSPGYSTSGLEDRLITAQNIEQARQAGARLRPACQIARVDPRTLQRWQNGEGLKIGDRRPQAIRPVCAHALSETERQQIVQVANGRKRVAVAHGRGQ